MKLSHFVKNSQSNQKACLELAESSPKVLKNMYSKFKNDYQIVIHNKCTVKKLFNSKI